jgi:hypothetical protein
VTTTGPEVADAVETLLGGFPRIDAARPAALEIRVQQVSGRDDITAHPSRQARLVFPTREDSFESPLPSGWLCRLYRDQERGLVDFLDLGLVAVDYAVGHAEVFLVESEQMHEDLRVNLIRFTLSELLKIRGLYTIHAAAVEKGGKGFLLPGATGRGKTTCCISLLRSGYRYLSDDHPLLRIQPEGPTILAFPKALDVTEKTIALIPELGERRARIKSGSCKQSIEPGDLYASCAASSCRPACILFPLIVDWPKSCLEPLPKSRAIEELLPQTLMALDKPSARRHFEALTCLVEVCECYRLYAGANILDLPDVLDGLLSRGGSGVGLTSIK